MKKILLLAAFFLSLAPASAEMLKGEVATSYSKVVDGWIYITNAKEFMLLAQECQDPNVGEKKVRLACDIEYPNNSYSNANSKYYIKYFNGVFDGMGSTIKFYMQVGTSVDAAFIQELKGESSEVCNLQFDDCHVELTYSATGSAALVVGKTTAEESNIHDIYVNGGTITGNANTTALGGLVCKIGAHTTISHCALVGLSIIWTPNPKDKIGFFCSGLLDGATLSNCTIRDCYMSQISGSTNMAFSCLTNYDGVRERDLDKYKSKNKNCFYVDDCTIVATDLQNNDFKYITKLSATNLKSGDTDVLMNEDETEWKYAENQVPLPAGLFYWNPKKSYTLCIGTYGSSQKLDGTVIPADYQRYTGTTQLKLVGIQDKGNTAYVIDDDYTTETGVKNTITTMAANIFRNISMTTLQLPGKVTDVEGSSFLHGVSDGFISNGNWMYAGNLLYLITSDIRRLMTSVGTHDELTIDGYYCTSILDGALIGQTALERLYVNTWFPVGAETFPPITLLSNSIFNDCPSTMKVYIKDGTQTQRIIGADIDHGYKNHSVNWSQFYSESEDKPNRLLQYFPVKRNPAGLSTLMIGYPVVLPSDCKAWVATGVSEGALVLKRVSGRIVPALLPVLLSYEITEGTMDLLPYEGANPPVATDYEGGLFKGSIDVGGHKMTDSEMTTNFLTLSRPTGDSSWNNVGFYAFHPTDGILPSYVAWISKQDVPSSAKIALLFDGDYDMIATPIRSISEEEQQDAPVYNLSGQRVGSHYRGLVVRNGKKYLVK